MIHTLYIEDGVAAHPRVRQICRRFPHARRVTCGRYTEVFNPKAQNFRLQKKRPALILAEKFEHFVHPAPTGYGIGGTRNFYFSHMLNCLYDCRYCFLQGMFRSAHYVLFVNYEDFEKDITRTIEDAPEEDAWFFSGYDCDSLALEPVTDFATHFLPFFEANPQARLELRTKSTQIRALLKREPPTNCVVAFSFSPQDTAEALEHRAPSIAKRIEAVRTLQNRGWNIGLRFDPLIYQEDYRHQYAELFRRLFSRISLRNLHSVSLGPFRLPTAFFRTVQRLYPSEPLFAGPLADHQGMVGYHRRLENELVAFCSSELLRYIPEPIFFPCVEESFRAVG